MSVVRGAVSGVVSSHELLSRLYDVASQLVAALGRITSLESLYAGLVGSLSTFRVTQGAVVSAGFVEFGESIDTKAAHAGRVGYTYMAGSNALDIVGAGPIEGGRRVKVWDRLTVADSVTAASVSATSITTTTSTANVTRVPGTGNVEFGYGVTKEANAGKIVYQAYSAGLDIIGAGTTWTGTGAPRLVTIHDDLLVQNKLYVGGYPGPSQRVYAAGVQTHTITGFGPSTTAAGSPWSSSTRFAFRATLLSGASALVVQSVLPPSVTVSLAYSFTTADGMALLPTLACYVTAAGTNQWNVQYSSPVYSNVPTQPAAGTASFYIITYN